MVALGPGLKSHKPHFPVRALQARYKAAKLAREGCMAMSMLWRPGALGRGENGTLPYQLFTLDQNPASDFTPDLDLDLSGQIVQVGRLG